MADIDRFATQLLEESKRFLEKAEKAEKDNDDESLNAFLHSSLLLAFCSLEAHINAVSEEMAVRPELTPHERGVLLEKEVKLEDGLFVLGGLRMYRLDERICYLHARFSGCQVDKSQTWWTGLKGAIDVRNRLTHPKAATQLTVNVVRVAIVSIIETIDSLYHAIYKKGLPAANRGLVSRMTF